MFISRAPAGRGIPIGQIARWNTAGQKWREEASFAQQDIDAMGIFPVKASRGGNQSSVGVRKIMPGFSSAGDNVKLPAPGMPRRSPVPLVTAHGLAVVAITHAYRQFRRSRANSDGAETLRVSAVWAMEHVLPVLACAYVSVRSATEIGLPVAVI